EAEAPSALDDLRDAVDLDDLLIQVELGRIDPCHTRVSSRLQVEAALAGTLSERADPPVVLVAAAVEADRGNARGLRPLGDGHANRSRHVHLGGPGEVALAARRRSQRPAGRVIDDLGIDVLRAAEDRQARTLGAAADAEAQARVSLATQDVAG